MSVGQISPRNYCGSIGTVTPGPVSGSNSSELNSP